MNEREKQIIYDALCEILIIAKEHNGYYQCNYSMDEIQELAEKYIPTPDFQP